MTKIPVFQPMVQAEEISAAVESLEMGWLGMGSYVGRFEDALHDYLGAGDRKVVAVSTGHAALHLGLILSGAGPGDEVITPAFNNIADFQAILAVGARPVFCDIDPDTLCINIDQIESLITSDTKAVIAMDYFCHLCDHSSLADIADRHGIRLIHDAAHSLGSSYEGKKVGSFSDITMFSFDPVKTITCIDGGALIVQTQEEMERLHELRLIGMGQPSAVMYKNERAWTYDVQRMGFRYHMANLHAAIGLEQLKKMDGISSSRQRASRRFNDNLNGLAHVSVPETSFEGIVPFLYYIRVEASHREGLRQHLSQEGIDTGVHWQPGHWFSLFKDCRQADLSVTDRTANEILSLPLHSGMSDQTVDRICGRIHEYFKSELQVPEAA